MIKNGRQIATTLAGIRDDHRVRYEYAAAVAREKGHKAVVNAGCGAGYGCVILAAAGCEVIGYDIDASAIYFGDENWPHAAVTRFAADIATVEMVPFDMLVAFEIIEHFETAPNFLRRVPTDHMIGSVPNEDVVPFETSKHRQHVRHYRPRELADMLDDAGWETVRIGCQIGKHGGEAAIRWDRTDGRTLVFEAAR